MKEEDGVETTPEAAYGIAQGAPRSERESLAKGMKRRGLLAAAFALAAGAVGKIAAPVRVEAQGDALLVGNTGTVAGAQTETSTTEIQANTPSGDGLFVNGNTYVAIHGKGSYGVRGESENGIAVSGESSNGT